MNARVDRFTDYNRRVVFDPNGNLVKFTAYEQLALENERLRGIIQIREIIQELETETAER